jgi:hypothetical protein
MKVEEAKLIEANGGKPLNYFLLPKCYSKSRKQNKKDDSKDYYIVPLIYGRLSKPKIV